MTMNFISILKKKNVTAHRLPCDRCVDMNVRQNIRNTQTYTPEDSQESGGTDNMKHHLDYHHG